MNTPVTTNKNDMAPILETACTFGLDSTLTGVYTPPMRGDTSKPCAVFITAGLLHHVGPTRLHVELARTLSDHNIAGLRFDLSGAGDSETNSMGGYFVDRSANEIIQAMNYLEEEHGYKRFVLIGLCSGADDALATAQRDKRVTGIVFLNGYSYKAGWFFVNRVIKFYIPRLFMWRKIRHKAEKLINRSSKTSATVNAALTRLDDDYRHIPPRQEIADLLKYLCQVKTDLMFVYTGSEHDTYTYGRQFYAMFPELRSNPYVKAHYLKESDHTFILKSDRNKVIGWIVEWFEQGSFSRSEL